VGTAEDVEGIPLTVLTAGGYAGRIEWLLYDNGFILLIGVDL
jgi:hypothetical protein